MKRKILIAECNKSKKQILVNNDKSSEEFREHELFGLNYVSKEEEEFIVDEFGHKDFTLKFIFEEEDEGSF